MKAFFITLFFSFIAGVSAGTTVLHNVYENWQNRQKTSTVQAMGLMETTERVELNFGESFSKTDPIRNSRVSSVTLDENVVKIIVEFPHTIFDLSEIPAVNDDDYIDINTKVSLPVENSKDYKVELWGIHSLQTASGKTVKEDKKKLFATFNMLGKNSWLANLKKKLEDSRNPNDEFKAFLQSKLSSFEIETNSYEEVGAKLKKLLNQNGYDLIFLPGSDYSENNETYKLKCKEPSILEVIQRIAFLKGLKYKIGSKEVVIASAKTFEKSKSIKNRDGLVLPGLKVDTKNGSVELDAKVCLSSGILEYLLCMPHSFEHESIFMSKVKPELLHMGLLLIGRKPMPYKNRLAHMQKLTDNVARVSINIQWRDKGQLQAIPLNKLLVSRAIKKGNKTANDRWFFSGSYFNKKNVYAANIHQSFISLQQHPASVIHYGEVSEDPYRSETGGFEVNEKLCPPMETEVKIIFTKY